MSPTKTTRSAKSTALSNIKRPTFIETSSHKINAFEDILESYQDHNKLRFLYYIPKATSEAMGSKPQTTFKPNSRGS